MALLLLTPSSTRVDDLSVKSLLIAGRRLPDALFNSHDGGLEADHRGSATEERKQAASMRLWLALLILGGGLFGALWVLQVHLLEVGLHGPESWFVPRDWWDEVRAGEYIAYGAFGYAYDAPGRTAVQGLQALPGLALLYAPAVRLGDSLGLVMGAPLSLARPTMWLVTYPIGWFSASFAIMGIDSLAAELGVRLVRRKVLAVGIMAWVVFPTVILFGHPEDCLALGLAILAISDLIKGRCDRGAWLLGFAGVAQPWAGLLAPIYLAATPAPKRLSSLLRMAMLPASMVAFFSAVDPGAFWHAFGDQPTPCMHNVQPLPSCRWAPLAHFAGSKPIDFLRSGTFARRWAILPSLLAALLLFRSPSKRAIVIAVGVVMGARGLTELVATTYYLLPASAVVLLAAAMAKDTKKWLIGTLLGASVLATWLVRTNPWTMWGVIFMAVVVPLAWTSLCYPRTEISGEPIRAGLGA